MSSLKLGHVWSKTRSLGQILDRPYKRSRFLKYRTAKVIYVTQVSDIGPLGPLVLFNKFYFGHVFANYGLTNLLVKILTILTPNWSNPFVKCFAPGCVN